MKKTNIIADGPTIEISSMPNKPLIIPSIRVDGEKNLLEEMYEGDHADLPELKAVGYAKMGGGNNTWMSYVITFKGSNVLKIEVEEPDQRAIAEDNTKVQFVNLFMSQE